MKTYADTSSLFSLYAADAHSARADAWRQANPAPLPFTAFHRLELRSALSLNQLRFMERESQRPTAAHWDHEPVQIWRQHLVKTRQPFLPLLGGEGRGEGGLSDTDFAPRFMEGTLVSWAAMR